MTNIRQAWRRKVVFSDPTVAIVPHPVIRNATLSSEPPGGATPDRKAIAAAKAKYGYPWWASKDPLEVFLGQLNETVPIVPANRFHECAKQAMGRDVFVDELADREALKDEFFARTPETTCHELMRKICPKRTAPRMARLLICVRTS